MRPPLAALLFAVACALWCGCSPRNEVVVFHATSLARVFGELKDVLQEQRPARAVRLEPSGSQVAARKVSEQGLKADVVAVADDAILRRLLPGPEVIVFATNELVLAHLSHSQGTDEITGANWPEVLARPGVRLGRVDEDLAPLGYHTLLAWELAEQQLAQPGLAGRLRASVAKEHVAHDETDLLAMLEARALDYAFLYRSTAEDHRLKVTALPEGVNLSRPERAQDYARAKVSVRLRSSGPAVEISGRAITYGLVVPANANNPEGAKAFVALLLSDAGQKALTRHGFRPLVAPERAP